MSRPIRLRGMSTRMVKTSTRPHPNTSNNSNRHPCNNSSNNINSRCNNSSNMKGNMQTGSRGVSMDSRWGVEVVDWEGRR